MSETKDGLEKVTAASFAGLLEKVAGTPFEVVVLDLARRTIRGRCVMSQLARLAEVVGPGSSWGHLSEVMLRVEVLAESEDLSAIPLPRDASEWTVAEHVLAAARIRAEEHGAPLRRRFEAVARSLEAWLEEGAEPREIDEESTERETR